MEIAALLVIQLIATAAAFGLIWRKLDVISGDVARIKRMLETLELMRFSSGAQKRAAQPARAEPVLAPAAPDAPRVAPDAGDDPFSATWVRPGARVPREEPLTPGSSVARPLRAPAPRQMMSNDLAEDISPLWRANVSPETGRIVAAAAIALTPALGFLIGAPTAALIASGLSISAALMLVALRPMWGAAAFVGVLAAGGWAVTAFALESPQAAPILFSVFAALAGAAGLAHAHERGMAPGAAMALVMGAAMLALGNAIGLAGAAGVGFGALLAMAAIVGAVSTRLQGLHLSAFAAAMAGLWVFSGQADAAIWFTPVSAWMGALFFAIAAVRAPVLGARGAVLSATGVAAPLLSAGSLSLSQHGLANPLAAAGAFLSLALMFVALLTVAAQRGQRGVKALYLTGWIFTAAALIAFATAALLALPTDFAATALAALALGIVGFDHYRPQRLWRAAAVGAFAVSALIAWWAVRPAWPGLLTIASALALPTLIASGAAYVSQRTSAGAAAVFEGTAIAGGAATITALLRFALSGGAPSNALIGFVEAGLHIGVWAAASLALAALSHRGATLVRRASSATFGLAALCGGAIAGLLWLTPFWTERLPSGVDLPLLQHAPLGFAAPAILAWAHWVYWRARGKHMRTRVSLGAAGLLTAAFIALEVLNARIGAVAASQADWVSIASLVAIFGFAIGINFAPGVTADSATGSRFDKYFQRDRGREQRT